VVGLSLTLVSGLLYVRCSLRSAATALGWLALAPCFFALSAARGRCAPRRSRCVRVRDHRGRDRLGGADRARLLRRLDRRRARLPRARLPHDDRALLRRRSSGPRRAATAIGVDRWWLCAPVAWVAAEYARSEAGLRSSWCLLGDAYAGSGALRQIADVTGVYGVGAVLALVNAALAERGGGRSDPASRRVAVVAAAVLAVAIGYGTWRAPESPQQRTIAARFAWRSCRATCRSRCAGTACTRAACCAATAGSRARRSPPSRWTS